MHIKQYKIPTVIELSKMPNQFYNLAIGLYLLHMALMAELTFYFPDVLMRFRIPSFLLVAVLALAAVSSQAIFKGVPLRSVLVYFVFLLMAVSGTLYQPENFVYVEETVFQGYFIKYVLLFSALFLFEDDPDVRIRQLTIIALAVLLMYQYGVSQGMYLNEEGDFEYMSVGYGCAPWWAIFAQGIFYYKKKLAKLFCLIGSFYFAGFILNYGNRGALAVIVVTLAILLIVYIPLKYLVLLGGFLLLTMLSVFLFLQPIMEMAGNLLGFDLTMSRNFRLLSSGRIGYDSGRIPIYDACFNAILQHPFCGNGSYGDRAATSAQLAEPFYAHNIVLELCVDFGVIIGALIYVWLLYIGFRMLFRCQSRNWRALFLPLYVFSMVQLFFSGTFYQSGYLLASIIIYFTYTSQNRRTNCRKGTDTLQPAISPVKGGSP